MSPWTGHLPGEQTKCLVKIVYGLEVQGTVSGTLFAGTLMALMVSADHLRTAVVVETIIIFKRKRHAALPAVTQLEISAIYQ